MELPFYRKARLMKELEIDEGEFDDLVVEAASLRPSLRLNDIGKTHHLCVYEVGGHTLMPAIGKLKLLCIDGSEFRTDDWFYVSMLDGEIADTDKEEVEVVIQSGQKPEVPRIFTASTPHRVAPKSYRIAFETSDFKVLKPIIDIELDDELGLESFKVSRVFLDRNAELFFTADELERHRQGFASSNARDRYQNLSLDDAPKPRVLQTMILDALKEINALERIPKNPGKDGGPKRHVRDLLRVAYPRISKDMFDKAWEKLRKDGHISYVGE